MSRGWVLLLGLGLGTGLAMVWSSLPAFRRPVLAARVDPYLGSTPSAFRGEPPTVSPFPTVERLLRPSLIRAAAALDRWLGAGGSVGHRLDRLGSPSTIEQFRLEQLAWGMAGMVGAIAILVLRSARAGSPGGVMSVVVLGLAFLLGVFARDRRLTRDVQHRETRMRAEFPTLAELLALSVSAGEGAAAALERVSRVAHGDLAQELRRALDDVRLGRGLVDALQDVAARVELPELRRFVDGVVIAVDRGTPLAAVLQAQAADARDSERRALIELGGRKDIAMMVPVVFLVLPLSVVFALFPGFYGISLSSP